MPIDKYVISAQRKLPCGTTSRITKAIEEMTPSDALLEFCNLLGVSPAILDNPEGLGTECWDLTICGGVNAVQFRAAKARFNVDPVRSDFRAGEIT